MKKLVYSFLLLSIFAFGCKEKVDPALNVSSVLAAGDPNVLIAYTVLAGSNEVPAVTSSATGKAVGTYNKTSRILNLALSYDGITPVAWHLHKAAAGANGGVVFNFGSTFTSPFAYVTPVALTAAQESDLLGGLNYVNMHSAKSPSGEIRGQLSVAATKATGTVSGTFNKTTKILSLSITYAGITPTLWHIHKGAAGVSGPVVLDIGKNFTSPYAFTTTALTAEQETDLLAGNFYVNIHSAQAPSGEIRGQILVK